MGKRHEKTNQMPFQQILKLVIKNRHGPKVGANEKIRKGLCAVVAFQLKASDSRKWATGRKSRGPREEAAAGIQTPEDEVRGQCGAMRVRRRGRSWVC